MLGSCIIGLPVFVLRLVVRNHFVFQQLVPFGAEHMARQLVGREGV